MGLGEFSVVVGRFQVDELTEGHKWLLREACARNKNVLVALGVGPLPTSPRKPLPFETRKAIIQEEFPDVEVRKIHDHPDDTVWSNRLDDLVRSYSSDIGPHLYRPLFLCSRDSFRNHYHGHWQDRIVEMEAKDLGVSGTLRRDLISSMPGRTQDFAKGVIWANLNRFPTVYGVVDMMVYRGRSGGAPLDILLINKIGRDGYYLPGGFCDVGSECDEDDASRETWEEAGVTIPESAWCYEKSFRIPSDWRYAGEPDEMRTRVFSAWVKDYDDTLEPQDTHEIQSAVWVPLTQLRSSDLAEDHRKFWPLMLDNKTLRKIALIR